MWHTFLQTGKKTITWNLAKIQLLSSYNSLVYPFRYNLLKIKFHHICISVRFAIVSQYCTPKSLVVFQYLVGQASKVKILSI